jgi:branched-subunit amino acid aminotransferase/4-amino-4-deoxychorismate lyase
VDYDDGVKVLTRTMHRENAKAKLTGFIHTAAELRQGLPANVNEILMIDADDCILEGLSSNFFGVLKGVLWTANEGVLNGITRQIVLEIAGRLGIPVHFACLPLCEIPNLQECFITSASRAVLPVVQIERTVIGTGKPGEITRRLLAGFQDWIQQEAAEV